MPTQAEIEAAALVIENMDRKLRFDDYLDYNATAKAALEASERVRGETVILDAPEGAPEVFIESCQGPTIIKGKVEVT